MIRIFKGCDMVLSYPVTGIPATATISSAKLAITRDPSETSALQLTGTIDGVTAEFTISPTTFADVDPGSYSVYVLGTLSDGDLVPILPTDDDDSIAQVIAFPTFT